MIGNLIFLLVGAVLGGSGGVALGVALMALATEAADAEEWDEDDLEDEELADHKGWCMAKLSSEYECDCSE